MSKKFISCVLVSLPVLLFSPVTHAYDGITTHPMLTDEIVDFYNLTHHGQELSAEVRTWIIEGSQLEDTPPRWVNHFYDPISGEGWTGEKVGTIAPLAVRMFAQFGLAQGKPLSTNTWVNDDLRQSDYARYAGDKTWKKALDFSATDNMREAYVALGHTLHLLEDMSVPDHTRNDTHAPLGSLGDEGSPFEAYLSIKKEKTNLGKKLANAKEQAVQKNSIEEYINSLALYSNKYFFSKDTISDPKYKFPKIIDEIGQFGYGEDETGGIFPIVEVKKAKQENLSFKKIYLIEKTNTDILDSYFLRLSRQVVLHGAGAIELFFKQAEDAKINKDFPTHVVQYDRTWGRIPVFSFVGELAQFKSRIGSFFGDVTSAIADMFSNDQEAVVELETDLPEENEPVVLPETKTVLEEAETEIIEEENNIEEIPEDTNEEVKNENTENKPDSNTEPKTVKNTASYMGGYSSRSDDAKWDSVIMRITEIMYDAEGSDDKKEWIEVLNGGSSPASVAEMKLVEGGTRHSMEIVRGAAELTEGQYAVVASDTNQFLSDFPAFSGTLLDSSFSLSNNGERIAIEGGSRELNSVSYASSSGARGDGNSLQLVDGVWRALSPTPGTQNTYTPPQNNAPIALFDFDPVTFQAGDVIRFDASSSSDADGSIIEYEWDFGDFVHTTSTLATTTHAYAAAGSYEARLTVYDNTSASSTRMIFLEISPRGSRGADHVVISEVQIGGEDAGDEFIELYNPTDSPVELSLWSLQYVSGSADTVSISTASKKNFSDGNILLPHSFFLVARGKDGEGTDGYRGRRVPDLSHRTFSLSGASTGGKIFLVRDQYPIDNGADPDIVDNIDYSFLLPENNNSIERRAWMNGACVSALPDNEGTFSGHGCDSDMIGNDFEIRAVSNPQNTESLIEPRRAPTAPTGNGGVTSTILSYNSDTLTISFSWEPSVDFQNATSTLFYTLYEVGSSTRIVGTTTAVMYEEKVRVIGKEYIFALVAEDEGGYRSATTSLSVVVPGFFSSFHLYQDPNASDAHYHAKAFYDRYPFVPRQMGNEAASRLLLVYLNRDPENIGLVEPENVSAVESIPGLISFSYEGCTGSKSGKALVFPDGEGLCMADDLMFTAYESSRFLFDVDALGELGFSPTDFFTVAFYDKSDLRKFEFVATDARRFVFGDEPRGGVPSLTGAPNVAFNESDSRISVTWDKATDSDSLVKEISYEINISPLGGINEATWQELGAKTEYVQYVNMEEEFLISVRAKDGSGNVSSVVQTEWRTPAVTMGVAQTSTDTWSSRWGMIESGSDGSVSASFMRIAPDSDFSFNTAAVRLMVEKPDYASAVRLSVFPETPSSTVDFAHPLGRVTKNNLLSADPEKDFVMRFDSSLSFASGTPYWLVLDTADPGTGSWVGFSNVSWKNAVKTGSEAYARGYAGQGYAQGPQEQCLPQCGYRSDYTGVGPSDWYLKLGLRE